MKVFLSRIFVLVLLSVILGGLRQIAPQGITWRNSWPTRGTSSDEAYKLMAKPGDPPFISLADSIAAQKNSTATFIDARSNKEFSDGHIPHARNLPYYQLDSYQDAALKDLTADSEIIIYCEGIGCELSFFLGRELKEAGYTNMHIFYGGYPEWKDSGQPIEK